MISSAQRCWEDLHIDGGEGTVGDGAADGAGKGESGVEGNAAQLGLGLGIGGHLDDFDEKWWKIEWSLVLKARGREDSRKIGRQLGTCGRVPTSFGQWMSFFGKSEVGAGFREKGP